MMVLKNTIILVEFFQKREISFTSSLCVKAAIPENSNGTLSRRFNLPAHGETLNAFFMRTLPRFSCVFEINTELNQIIGTTVITP